MEIYCYFRDPGTPSGPKLPGSWRLTVRIFYPGVPSRGIITNLQYPISTIFPMFACNKTIQKWIAIVINIIYPLSACVSCHIQMLL